MRYFKPLAYLLSHALGLCFNIAALDAGDTRWWIYALVAINVWGFFNALETIDARAATRP